MLVPTFCPNSALKVTRTSDGKTGSVTGFIHQRGHKRDRWTGPIQTLDQRTEGDKNVTGTVIRELDSGSCHLQFSLHSSDDDPSYFLSGVRTAESYATLPSTMVSRLVVFRQRVRSDGKNIRRKHGEVGKHPPGNSALLPGAAGAATWRGGRRSIATSSDPRRERLARIRNLRPRLRLGDALARQGRFRRA